MAVIGGRQRNTDNDRWPPRRCGACESEQGFARAGSDHPGYRVCRCRSCGHRVYRLRSGQMVMKDQSQG